MNNNNKFKKPLLSAASVLVLALSGCSTSYNSQTAIAVAIEPIGPSTKREIGEKYLHTHSLQQQLMLLGSKSGEKIYFSGGSDDVFVSDILPRTFALGVSKSLTKNKNLAISWKKTSPYTKRVSVSNKESSIFSSLLKKHITTNTILETENLTGDFLVGSDAATHALTSSLGVDRFGFFPVKFIFNRIYTQGKRKGVPVYFSYSDKSKVLFYTTSPKYMYLTPYKRQLFVNYLDSKGVSYLTSSKNGLAISDNFENWAMAMDKLSSINKYQYSVYGIFDGHNFFEIADSNYRDSSLVVEMIDWSPDGKRAYNVYYKGHHRKIITDQRFIYYYAPDGTDKFLIRFY